MADLKLDINWNFNLSGVDVIFDLYSKLCLDLNHNIDLDLDYDYYYSSTEFQSVGVSQQILSSA